MGKKTLMSTSASSGIWSRQFISIFCINVLFNFCQQMANSVLSKYSDSLGFPTSQIGFLMSSFAITAFVFRFIAGPAIDSGRRKTLLLYAMGLTAIAYLGFALSSRLFFLIFFRLLQGIASAFGNACCLAIVADILPKNRFTVGVGYFSCAMVIAQALGPAFGLQFIKWFQYENTYLFNAFVMLISVLILMLTHLPKQETKKIQFQGKNILAKEAILPATVLFFTSSGFAAVKSFLIVYAGKRDVDSQIGLYFTIYAITLLLTRPVISKLIDRYGFTKVGIPSFCLTIVSLVIISIADQLWLFLVAAIIDATGYGAIQPAIQSLCLKAVPSERRGSATSTYFIGLDSATILVPPLAGALEGFVGYPSMWRLLCIPILIGICIVFVARKKTKAIETDFLA